VKRAGIIGAVQGLCLPFRGFSRSGAAIYAGMLLSVAKQAERFSFALGLGKSGIHLLLDNCRAECLVCLLAKIVPPLKSDSRKVSTICAAAATAKNNC
jgi:hypothetical protein